MSDVLETEGVGVAHYFGKNLYVKQAVIQPGYLVKKHTHDYDHISILAMGKAAVEIEDEITLVDGPAVITVAAGKQHSVEALTQVVWFCVHSTVDTNIESHLV